MTVAMARRTVKCPHSRQQEGRTSESDAVDRSRRPDDTGEKRSEKGPIEGEKVDERALVAIAVRAGWTDQRLVFATRKRVNGRARSGVLPPLFYVAPCGYCILDGERINTSLVSYDTWDIYSPPCTLTAITSEFALFLSPSPFLSSFSLSRSFARCYHE